MSATASNGHGKPRDARRAFADGDAAPGASGERARRAGAKGGRAAAGARGASPRGASSKGGTGGSHGTRRASSRGSAGARGASPADSPGGSSGSPGASSHGDASGSSGAQDASPSGARRIGPAGLRGLARATVSAAASLPRQLVRVPPADLDERDPDYIRETLPRLWLAATLWYRGEVRGLGNVPESGPVLLVGNHSGGNLTPDTLLFTLAFSTYFGVEREFHQLAHNLVLSYPGLSFLRKYGTVAASHDNAARALSSGAAVLVYPGGDYDVHRPSWHGNKIDFGGRKGFIKLAIDQDVPIVPVVGIGGQETALFLSRGEHLAKALGLDRLFRLKVLPISLSLPWIVNVGDFLGHIPLPAKLTVEALPPIHLRAEFGDEPDVDEVYEHIVRLMQDTLDALAAERRFPVIG